MFLPGIGVGRLEVLGLKGTLTLDRIEESDMSETSHGIHSRLPGLPTGPIL